MDPTAGRDAREAAQKAAPAETLTAALTAALDGRWGSLRREVRAQLAGAGMRDGSGLPMEEYRRQVFDDLHLLAKTAHARLGFDREYGGMSDPAGSVVAHEMLGFGDLSLMVKAGRAVGAVRRRRAASRYPAAPRTVPARHHGPAARGLLRDDRDRTRLGRPAPADHGDVRPGRGRVRDQHAGYGGAQGLHRQRGPGRPDGGRLRPAHRGRRRARRARAAGADPGR